MLERMLIDKIENRILVGVSAFVGVMILVGWVAINENARMASFERQYEARAIERGAELFAANCSTCHGEEGLGIGGRAPGLNSPHFFGYDFFEDINNEITVLEGQQQQILAERTTLSEELVEDGVTDERRAEIQEEIVALTEQISGEGGLEAQLAELEQQKMDLIGQLQPAVVLGYPIEQDTQDVDQDGDTTEYIITSARTSQVEWGGTLEQFITTTLVHGRPTSISYWGGNQMVAWSQRAGGPLRDDQIGDIASYILNWDKGDDWTIADALSVGQYAIVPGIGGAPPEDTVGTDVDAILATWEEEGIEGDAARGEALYNSAEMAAVPPVLGCSGCHGGGVNGPETEGTWDRVLNERLTLDQFADYTPEQYLVESIVAPEDYIAPGWSGGVMPGGFGGRLSNQDLADIIAYLETQTGG